MNYQEKMELVDELKSCTEENKIEEIVARIDDLIKRKTYSLGQVKDIVEMLNNFDLLSVRYTTREQILYTMTDIIVLYELKDGWDLNKLLIVKEYLEDDLKEYIDEILNIWR